MQQGRWIGVPTGLRDELYDEAERRRRIEDGVLAVLASHGYRAIRTPVLEYYDLFIHAGLPMRQEAMVKLEDRAGRMCVMRPDSTLAVARIAASKLAGDAKPLRVAYAQPVFRVTADGRVIQTAQAGAECIGAAGAEGDREMMGLMLETLSAQGLRSLHLELGHAGLIPSMIAPLGLSDEDAAELTTSYERRNFARLRDILMTSPRQSDAQRLLRLTIDGDMDTLKELEKSGSAETRRCAAELLAHTAMAETLAGQYQGVNVTPDGAMVTRMDYYTGLMFRLYTPGAPREVATGGRYDGLMERFAKPDTAIGFVMELDTLLTLEVSR